MNKALEYIRDISCLISENYSDKEPLTEEQKLSKNCFLDYCKYIEKELKRLEAIDNTKPSEALEKVNKVLESCYEYEKKTGKNAIVHISKEPLIEIQQALTEFKSLDLSLRLPSEQSSSHFTYKDKNLVCMQSTKYSKLMNAFLEYEKAQEQEKVLEIIIKKNVDIFWLYHTLTMVKFEGIIDGCKYYNNYHAPNCVVDNNLKTIRNENLAKLTQEEFDLLTRRLENE